MNYYEEFLNMIESDALNELLKNTCGSDEVEKAIKGLYKMFKMIKKRKKRIEFDQKLSLCLALVNELWFNVGWSCGWTAGAVTISKLTGIDQVDVTKISLRRSDIDAEGNKRNRQSLHTKRAKRNIRRIRDNTT